MRTQPHLVDLNIRNVVYSSSFSSAKITDRLILTSIHFPLSEISPIMQPKPADSGVGIVFREQKGGGARVQSVAKGSTIPALKL